MAIVYFDGHCNLCNGFIDFLIRRDHRRQLKYAPIQGTTAAKRLPPELRSDLTTMVFETDGQIFTESAAALETIVSLGGAYRVAKVFLLVPRFLRDSVYRFVAKHRYLFAARRDSCRLPTPAERAQFLD